MAGVRPGMKEGVLRVVEDKIIMSEDTLCSTKATEKIYKGMKLSLFNYGIVMCKGKRRTTTTNS
jgi:hypothetical protein